MKKIFLSYKYDDVSELIIEKLNKEINNIGFEFIAPPVFDFCSNDSFQYHIQEQIDESVAVVALLRNPSDNVFLELGFALGRNKRILIFADPKAKIPLFLHDIQYTLTEFTPDLLLPQILLNLEKLSTEHLLQKENLQDVTIKELKENPTLLSKVDHNTLENLIADYYRKKGYEVRFEGVKRDMGYDLVAIDPISKKKILIEIKKRNLNSKVNIGDIRQLYYAIEYENADAGTILSTSGFTGSAAGLSGDLGESIELKSFFDLEDE